MAVAAAVVAAAAVAAAVAAVALASRVFSRPGNTIRIPTRMTPVRGTLRTGRLTLQPFKLSDIRTCDVDRTNRHDLDQGTARSVLRLET
jgi:hypothetical protein